MSSHTDLIKKLTALNQIAETLNQTVDVQSALEGALARLVELMGLETGWIFLRDPEGIVGVTRDEALWAIPPQVEVVSPVGAGDSAVAGFIYALTKGMDFRESLILATATGTAAVKTPGTELCKTKDVAPIKQEITIKKL